MKSKKIIILTTLLVGIGVISAIFIPKVIKTHQEQQIHQAQLEKQQKEQQKNI